MLPEPGTFRPPGQQVPPRWERRSPRQPGSPVLPAEAAGRASRPARRAFVAQRRNAALLQSAPESRCTATRAGARYQDAASWRLYFAERVEEEEPGDGRSKQ